MAKSKQITEREWLDAQPTREGWLRERVVLDLAPLFDRDGYALPPLRVACGWTGSGHEGCTLGVCYAPTASAAGMPEIFVSPTISDATEVLCVLMHELCHAVAGISEEHGEAFATVCKTMGMTLANDDDKGKWPEQAYPNNALRILLASIAAQADAYPHATLDPPPPAGGGTTVVVAPTPATQGTRMLKAMCAACGYTIRLTMKWATRGMPTCPCAAGTFALVENGGGE